MKKGKKAEEKEIREKKGPSLTTIILVVILLAGVAILLYPSVSDWWNSMHATRAIAGYVTAVQDLSADEREQILEAAKAYNRSEEHTSELQSP